MRWGRRVSLIASPATEAQPDNDTRRGKNPQRSCQSCRAVAPRVVCVGPIHRHAENNRYPRQIFTSLFAESRDALHRYIQRFVGSSETTKEIVQEAFLRTYRQGESVRTLRA